MSLPRSDLTDVFGAHGLLAQAVAGFAVRHEQAAMAENVAAAIARRELLIVEAGTGVGKTFAYLVPALLAGKRVIISTGTRSLQDQLFNRDLPAVGAALGRPVRVAILKGRANYLCRYRLELAEAQGAERGFRRELAKAIREVRHWSQRTRGGDIAELAALSEADPVWAWTTSTRDNCLGAQCSELQRCHVMGARREAQAADIVVVNHHLLLADLLLKDNGFGELLPGADAIIVDEAHQLPEVAAQAFGFTLSARQLRELARDLSTELLMGVGLPPTQHSLPQTLERLAEETTQSLAGGEQIAYSAWPDNFFESLHAIADALQQLVSAAEPIAMDHAGMAAIRARAAEMLERCTHAMSGSCEPNEPAAVRWAAVARNGFSVHYSPIDISTPLGELIRKQGAAWVFTSATLAVGEDFTHFKRRVGLPDAASRQFGSPFNYAEQALLYLPKQLEFPSSPQHTAQVVMSALPVLQASGGRAFLLFTSYRALREASAVLREQWGEAPPFPVLVQGEAPRDVLLRRFREYGNAVLLGTGSFWEGVDVKGAALTVVVIDKLPFAVPDDPLLKARLDAIERQGGNPFFAEQVPQAVVALKQGVGRLIRDMNDFGVVMLCDRRLSTRAYGRIFLDSLPPMKRTESEQEVCAFLQARLRELETEVARGVAL